MSHPPQLDKEELNVDQKIQLILTDWLIRMRNLGELNDFMDKEKKKGTTGWFVFDCPGIHEMFAQELTHAKEEERERMRKIIQPIQFTKLSKGWILSLLTPQKAEE